jgi:hypothetical protein
MNKKKVGIPIAALLTIIAGVAGGSYALDFSTNIDNSTTNNSSIINNFAKQLGMPVDKFKEDCNAGKFEGTNVQEYCDLI